MNWNEIVKIKETKEVDVEFLNFDNHNPRFTPDKQPEDTSDAAVINLLARTADLAELVQSIGTSGYINIEPLIVVLREEKLVVLEGNRRLAAIKALRNPDLADQARLALPRMTAKIKRTLNRVLVYRVAKEKDARELIGFKHINGPQNWDAFAKAVYAANWLEDEAKSEAPLTLAQIADRMGDKHATIHRMVTAYFVLKQAERMKVFDISNRYKRSFSFSHLYTGLSYPEFTNYLGMPKPKRDQDPSRKPVKPEKAEHLRNVLLWLYGSKEDEIPPVVRSQNPDLGKVRDILKSKSAIRVLEQTANLDDAIMTATPANVRFAQHVVEANASLRLAQETLDGFDPASQSELEVISASILRRARVIRNGIESQMQSFESGEDAD